jgi:ClpP class serine protease
MEVDAMNEVAQGRVWTGRQGLERGLVDHMGGLWKALEVAASLSNLHVDNKGKPIENPTYKVETLKEASKGLSLPFGILGQSASSVSSVSSPGSGLDALALCDDIVATTGLVSPSSFGVSAAMQSVGVSPLLQSMLRSSGVLAAAEEQLLAGGQDGIKAFLTNLM